MADTKKKEKEEAAPKAAAKTRRATSAEKGRDPKYHRVDANTNPKS